MPSQPSVSQFVDDLLSAGKRLQEAQPRAVKVAATQTRELMERVAVQTAGSDRQFSNLGKSKALLGARLRVDALGAETVATVSATGPWGISEGDTPAHQITAKLGKIAGRGAKRARRQRDLDVAFGARGAFSGAKPMGSPGRFGPRYSVRHPGTKGKHTWAEAGPEVARLASREIEAEIGRAVRGVYG